MATVNKKVMIPESVKSILVICLLTIGLTSIQGCSTSDSETSLPRPSCEDNIQNQGENGVDCGGPCSPCKAKLSASVNGSDWQAQGNINTSINGNSIIILSGNGTSTLSMIYTGPFTEGTYNLAAATYGITATAQNFISSEGSITFNSWDYANEQISGTFNFKAFDSSGSGDSVVVTQGNFSYVTFQP